MWNVKPEWMCRKHLLGEHVEMHMFVGSINKGKLLIGYTSTGLLDVELLQYRHDELAAEMLRRGYKHQSPLPAFDISRVEPSTVDSLANVQELHRRCKICHDRYYDVS